MPLRLNQIGQFALQVRDVDCSERFYEDGLGLRKLYRFGNLSFFDCAGIRLMLEQIGDAAAPGPSGCIYFRCADLELAACELERRGVTFATGPKLIAEMDDHDLRMAFFHDPDGHMLALMQEAPKGFQPRLSPNRMKPDSGE